MWVTKIVATESVIGLVLAAMFICRTSQRSSVLHVVLLVTHHVSALEVTDIENMEYGFVCRVIAGYHVALEGSGIHHMVCCSGGMVRWLRGSISLDAGGMVLVGECAVLLGKSS